MESDNRNTAPQFEKRRDYDRQGRIMAGLFIIVIGSLLLAKKAGVVLPSWLFSFEVLLIALGLFLGFRHSFKGLLWPIPILVGVFLLLDDFFPHFDITEYTWPLVIIAVGLFMVFGALKKKDDWRNAHPGAHAGEGEDYYLDSTAVFRSVHEDVVSKNFRGGEVVTIFGGTEINLTHADINGVVVIDLTQIFAGTKLIVPSHWRVLSKDVTGILGGVDDRRPVLPGSEAEGSNKTLLLEGICFLGKIDISIY